MSFPPSPCSEGPRLWPAPPLQSSPWAVPARDPHRWDPLLVACQHQARVQGKPQLLSLSQGFLGLDPLVVLAEVLGSPRGMGLADPSYCYLSHTTGYGRVRVLGLGSLRRLSLWGEARFQAARAFVEEIQSQVQVAAGGGSLTASGQEEQGAERPLCFGCFSFYPDCSSEPAAQLVFPEWQIWQEEAPGQGRAGSRTVVRLNVEVQPESNLALLRSRIHCFLAQMGQLVQQQLPPWSVPAPVQVTVHSENLLARLQKALEAIQAGLLEKIVLAEAVDLNLATPPCIPALLAHLEERYAGCSVFAFAKGLTRPERVFLGASPERLLSVWQGQIQIDALAGSAARGKTLGQDRALGRQLLQSAKDRREHQLVVQSVQEALQQVGVQPRISPQPRLLRLANIQHLQTLIRAEMPSQLHLFDLLEQLHPTAAVGGYPQQAAVNWLKTAEPFDRGGYAAPLGWVDLQGNGEFIVAIRSALLWGSQARLYAGAGIVATSCPEQEVAEIQLKLQSLAQALAIQASLWGGHSSWDPKGLAERRRF